jgi:cyclopropane fatty-acyl-phospholipid synthase-like methyltransferase
MAKIKTISQKPGGYFSEERREMLRFIPDNVKILLDVGCGEGGFSGGLIKERGITAWGIEKREIRQKTVELK